MTKETVRNYILNLGVDDIDFAEKCKIGTLQEKFTVNKNPTMIYRHVVMI